MRGRIRKRGKQSWEITYDVGRNDSGERIRRYETVTGLRRDAESRLAEILASLGQGTYVAPTKQTIGDYLRSWLDRKRHELKATTLESYGIIVNTHLVPSLGRISLQRLDADLIDAYYNEKRDTGLSEQTIKHHHRLLAKALKDAVRRRLIPRAPTDDVDAPKPSQREMFVIESNEIPALLDLFPPDWRGMIALAVTTGMRRSEVCGLQWDCVDLDGGEVDVRRMIEKRPTGLHLRESLKTKSSRRSIALAEFTVSELKRHRAHQAAQKLAGAELFDDQGFVFTRGDGSPVPPDSLSQAFKARVRNHDRFRRLTVHGLRHSHASHLLNAQVTVKLPDGREEIRLIHPKVVSQRLGHSTISITLDLYSHLLRGMDRDAAISIDQMLA